MNAFWRVLFLLNTLPFAVNVVAQKVAIPDGYLRAAIEVRLGKPPPWNEQDFKNLTIVATSLPVSSLEGLGSAHNLLNLILDGTALTNAIVPAGLASLQYLELNSSQKMTNLSLPYDLTNLTTLKITGSKLA